MQTKNKGMDVVEITQELVKINSENPPGNEKGMAEFVKKFLEDAGIEAELIESGKNRFNVVASIGSGEGGLMLNGHMDTVPIGEGWTEKPLGGEIKDGKLYGRGTIDMKGGVAAILAVAKKLAKESFRKRLLLTFVADEEAGGEYGSQYLIKNRKDLFRGIRIGVMAEPSGMENMRAAQKGITDIRLTFTGKAVHGSKPEQGINAIMKAVAFIAEAEKLRKRLLEKRHEMLGPATINVGKITGGTKVNVVPDKCVVDVDRRLIPGETPETAVRQFQDILKELGIEGKIESLAARDPMVLSKDSEIVKEITAVLPGVNVSGSSGYTEAEMYYKDLGIECVSWGPGAKGPKGDYISLAHRLDEYVDVKELELAAELFEKLVRRVCL